MNFFILPQCQAKYVRFQLPLLKRVDRRSKTITKCTTWHICFSPLDTKPNLPTLRLSPGPKTVFGLFRRRDDRVDDVLLPSRGLLSINIANDSFNLLSPPPSHKSSFTAHMFRVGEKGVLLCPRTPRKTTEMRNQRTNSLHSRRPVSFSLGPQNCMT